MSITSLFYFLIAKKNEFVHSYIKLEAYSQDPNTMPVLKISLVNKTYVEILRELNESILAGESEVGINIIEIWENAEQMNLEDDIDDKSEEKEKDLKSQSELNLNA